MSSFTCFSGEIYDSFPKTINPEANYVFYSHGKIVEGTNARPIHSRWGVYEYPKVKQAMVDDSYHLIAYHRPANTDAKLFAQKLVKDIHKLINAGVSEENISLVGFSRGGEITMLVSNLLKSRKIKTILLASCSKHLRGNKDYKLYGQIYSIYEVSDVVGSCQFLVDDNSTVDVFKEIAINTGEEHGAFYRPASEWIIPLKIWLKEANTI